MGLFRGMRSAPGAGKLLDPRSVYFEYPRRLREAETWCLARSAEGREAYLCAHLLTARRRAKEHRAPVLALRADADGPDPLAAAPESTAVVESSPGRRHLFMRREEMLNEEQKAYLQKLCASDRALVDTRRLTQDFAGMIRNLEGEKLDGWLEEAAGCEASVMKKFAAGLKKDLSAVCVGLTKEWSNGPVEGFVAKLKLLKRQGYGRANFDLLRVRILAAAPGFEYLVVH